MPETCSDDRQAMHNSAKPASLRDSSHDPLKFWIQSPGLLQNLWFCVRVAHPVFRGEIDHPFPRNSRLRRQRSMVTCAHQRPAECSAILATLRFSPAVLLNSSASLWSRSRRWSARCRPRFAGKSRSLNRCEWVAGDSADLARAIVSKTPRWRQAWIRLRQHSRALRSYL